MRLSFDTIDEVKDFVKQLKTTRKGKGEDDDADAGTGAAVGQQGGQAPAPILPPTGGQPNFTPGGAPGPTFTPGNQPPPNTMPAIVARINAQLDKLIAGTVPGQPAQPVAAIEQWLRTQVAPHDASAAAATLDQFKQAYLNKLPEVALNEMARLIGA